MGKQFDDVEYRYGAPMGRRHSAGIEPKRVHVFRVRFVDGDYDDGGAYWGGGSPLYCVRDCKGGNVQLFYRAKTRREAIEIMRSAHKHLTPIRGEKS